VISKLCVDFITLSFDYSIKIKRLYETAKQNNSYFSEGGDQVDLGLVVANQTAHPKDTLYIRRVYDNSCR